MSDSIRPPKPTELFCDVVEYLLLVAPVELVLEVAAIHEALPQVTTWGEARHALSAARFSELVEWAYGQGDPDDDEALDLSEPWPLLRYSKMPEWLPDDLELGSSYSSMLDSGTNYEAENSEEIEEALSAAGVTVRHDGPPLADLFEPM